jgi:hypothetical protein
MDKLLDSLLRNIYFNLDNPASYGSVAALYKEAKRTNNSVTLAQVKNWLNAQDTYTLQKPAIRKFARRKTIARGIGDQYQCDLCDMTALAPANKGFKYLLTCVDIFSKQAWAIAIKRKTAQLTAEAFKHVLKDGIPTKVQTDAGKEFLGAFKKLLDDKGITYFVATNPDIKCSVVERLNRTLKTKMWKYFTEHKTFKYIDVLQKLVTAYNHSYHRSIKMRPIDVTKENEDVVRHNLYGTSIPLRKHFKFEVGDRGRLAKGKSDFDKGYYEKWTREVFVVAQRKMADEAVYYVRDLQGEDIHGVFYGSELQKIA